MACTAGSEPPKQSGSCVNYARMGERNPLVGPLNERGIKVSLTSKAFTRLSEVRQPDGSIRDGPIGLRDNITIYELPGLANRIEVTFVSGHVTGILADWINMANEYKTDRVEGNPQAAVRRGTFKDPKGFDLFTLRTEETYIVQVCAYYDLP